MTMPPQPSASRARTAQPSGRRASHPRSAATRPAASARPAHRPTKRRPADAELAAAARADSPAALLAFQRTLKDALIRPLAPGDRTQRTWIDGRPMAEFAAGFIKPNDRLTALERLQIYNRMYWYRVLDCFHDDNPGLRALLGQHRFTRLAEAYLTRHPSGSFTLRNLCRHLPAFIRAEPQWTAPRTRLAWDVARFEWAQTVAFDEIAQPVLNPAELAPARPSRLRLALQPYLMLLALDHPVDEYVNAVKQRETPRGAASNATTGRHVTRARRVPLPKPARIHVAVHRLDGRLYYKRLDAPAFRMLSALQRGEPLARAIAAASPRVRPEDVRDWFATWAELGWFCARKRPRKT